MSSILVSASDLRRWLDEIPVEATFSRTHLGILDAENLYVSDQVDEAERHLQADLSEWVEPLSERELEVLQRIAEGLTSREIARRLYLSLNTVKVHSRNIYGKLGVRNRTQAVARAKELGVLAPS